MTIRAVVPPATGTVMAFGSCRPSVGTLEFSR
jgi:hypothetical protein